MSEKTFGATCNFASNAQQGKKKLDAKTAKEIAEREWWENIAVIRDRFIATRVEQLTK